MINSPADNNRLRPPADFDPAPGSRQRRAIIIIVSFGFLLSLFYRVSVAVISKDLTSDLGLDSGQLGDLTAAFFYAFALSQIPLGILLDRIGPRAVMTVLGLMGVAGAALFAAAGGMAGATWARILLGVGMSCNLMGTLALTASWFSIDRFALTAGIITALGTLGNLLAATPLALAAQALGWRGTFWVVAGINLVQVIALALVVRNHPPGAKRPANGRSSIWEALALYKTYFYWAISLATFVRYGFLVALQGLWLGPFLLYGLGFDLIQTGNALFMLGLGLLIALPLSGRLSDRWLATRRGVVWPSLVVFGLLVLGLSWLGSGMTHLAVYGYFFCLGFAAGPGQIMYAHIKELAPPQMTARAMTGINLFTMLGGAFFTQVLGFVLPAKPSALHGPGGFAPAWWLGAGCLGLAALLYAFTPETGVLKRKKG